MTFVHPIPKHEHEGPHGLTILNDQGNLGAVCACGVAILPCDFGCVDTVGCLRTQHAAHRRAAGVEAGPPDASTGA